MRTPFFFCFLMISVNMLAQQTSISFESHGKTAQLNSENPFQKFLGEWTLKNNNWSQNWGYGTENIKIEKHHTISSEINTKNSLISIVDGPEPNGHIFWTYNPMTKEVGHLSSFGDLRYGKGTGTIDENGNLQLKVSFEGEAKGTYRIYNYTWNNDDEYILKSVQYDQDDKPTGLFYRGTFVRIKRLDPIEEVKSVLRVLDDNSMSIDNQLLVYANTIKHMAPNEEVIDNKTDLKAYLELQRSYGKADMTHKVLNYEILGETILLQGEVVGTFYPKASQKGTSFRTKNFFVFKRIDGQWKIAKVIYNRSPNSPNK